MDSDHDDVFLTPAARLCELAEILAAGVLRLHVREALEVLEDGSVFASGKHLDSGIRLMRSR